MNSPDVPWFGAHRPEAEGKPADFGEAAATPAPLLSRYWRIVMRHRRMIAASTAAAAAIGLLITLMMTPRYLASATLEISRQQDRVVQVDEVKPESSFVDQEFYQTHYSLLEARTLAEAVVADLRLARDDTFFEMFGADPDKAGLFGDSAVSLTRAQLSNRKREATEILLDHISISPTRGSRLVTVGFLSPDAEFSARVVNSWTSNFIEQILARRFEATSYARNFLEQRLEQLRDRLEESERELVAYAGREQIINVPTGTQDTDGTDNERPIIADDLAALNRELGQATAARIAAASRMETDSDASTESLDNIALGGLRQQRAEAAAEHARLLTQFEAAYPPARAVQARIVQLDRAITREETRIRANLSSAHEAARQREEELQRQVKNLKRQFLDQRRRSIQYNIHQREADTNRQLYDALLQRYKEIGVAGGVGNNNIAVIDPAQVPDEPYSPDIAVNLIVALLAGLGLGVGMAFLIEQIDEAVRDPAQVPEMTGLPLLGVVPASEAGSPVDRLHDPKSPQSEAYLSVLTSLQFTTDHGVPKSLAVVSTRASEGKSVSAYAIALSLARTGRSVVLVDCDMRSPSVHKLAGVRNENGTSNYLAGQDNLDDAIQAVPDQGHWVLSAGPTPPNAGQLLTGARLERLIADLNRRFDIVVLDSPPVLGLADALLLSGMSEAVVYVIEANAARGGQIRTALNRLRQARVRPVGAILTKFDAKKVQYGYGYDYGYGYGRNDPSA